MSTPQYIIVGRLRADDRAVLRVASGPLAYAAELAACRVSISRRWDDSDTLLRDLERVDWLLAAERKELARKLDQLTCLF